MDKRNDFKKRVYEWTLSLIKFVDGLKKDRSADIMTHQLIRSGTSIAANYIEGQAASSKKDFINFLHHSLKSANESKFWLALLQDSGKAEKAEVAPILQELVELSNILGASLVTLKSKNEK